MDLSLVIMILAFALLLLAGFMTYRVSNLKTDLKQCIHKPNLKLSEKNTSYFVDQLSTNLTKKAHEIAKNNKISYNVLINAVADKFADLNAALKNKEEGQELVHKLKSASNDTDDASVGGTEQLDDFVRQVLDSQENLVYVVYPKLLKKNE